MMKRLLPFLALVWALSACKKGEPFDNLPPDTKISVSEINLVGEDRLRSEVTLHWFGSDQDGWVTGYELSLDGTNYSPVNVTDSTFNFVLSAGSDTADVSFYVRSIDNDGALDPTPAFLNVPIKNTPPTAIFDSLQPIPDTAFIVATLFLDVNDADGSDNLDSSFIRVNNGPWYSLAPTVTTVTLVPQDPTATGATDSDVYTGAAADLQSASISGLNLGGDNTVYLRARDIAGSESEIDTSKIFFVKNKTADVLVVDAHPGGSTPTPEDVYDVALANAIPNRDVIDLRSNGGANVPALWTPTFSFFVNFYDEVFWYSDASAEGVGLLESAAGAIQDFLSQDGKILISTSFPSTYDNTSVIQEYTPMDSISTAPGSVRIPTDSLLMPLGGFAGDYDSLQASVFIGRATPIYVKSIADTMFNAQLFTAGGWTGPSSVGARTRNAGGNTNMVFMSVELHQFNGRPAALEQFFNEVLLNEFNW